MLKIHIPSVPGYPAHPGFSAPILCPCPTHILVGNDMRDVLQEQLGSFLVLVQLLEEHAGFEVPYKERHRFRDP